ncbi:toll/interleukin-1 receptor domain-containing protein [Pseudomonas sp. Ps21-P2]|uniref:toll/interleukin-1 receptor domain-containing protein n=1 Tax=Pseudomonas sp. Ps21-P2 TaxID=3080331 RepID=UPI00320BA819
MKVFVSWSGRRSKAVAELLADWIKCVLQASQPWISTRDIDKGAIWFSEISDQLKDTAAGIVCLTQDNKNKPWILFETGALAKGLSTNRVCTFLVDLKPADIEDPLAQFNHTTADHSSMWGLVCSLNAGLETAKLNERILRQVFDTYWPQFDKEFKRILKDILSEDAAEPRSEVSILDEILSNTRALTSRVREIERQSFPARNFDSPDKVNHMYVESLAADLKFSVADVLNEGVSRGLTEEGIMNYIKMHRGPRSKPTKSLFEKEIKGKD